MTIKDIKFYNKPRILRKDMPMLTLAAMGYMIQATTTSIGVYLDY